MFSHDGEQVVASTSSKFSMRLFQWNTDTNVLVEDLVGPQVDLHAMAYHPSRSCLVTGMGDGFIDMWGIPMNWKAFAPDFQALQQNLEYREKEDEFDIDDGCDLESNELLHEDEIVDVVGIEKNAVFESDSEDEDDVFFLSAEVGEGCVHVKR